ncbi:hypothetical protein LguiB_021060 [Lonicera macranthoides]
MEKGREHIKKCARKPLKGKGKGKWKLIGDVCGNEISQNLINKPSITVASQRASTMAIVKATTKRLVDHQTTTQ